MKAQLAVCSAHLKDVESKLSNFLASPERHSDEKPFLREAITFVQKAREAISEAESKLDALHKRRNSHTKHTAHAAAG